MKDEIIREIHAVKDANGERFATVAALALDLARRECKSAASGRKMITPPLHVTKLFCAKGRARRMPAKV
jgi:hypothetical protein